MKKEEPKKDEQFYTEIRQIIETARTNAIRSVDFSRVQMYWLLGKRIFEEEQQGKDRADYGAYLIRNLAEELTPLYGSGFSVRQLEQSRRFYRMYPIANALRSQLDTSDKIGDFALTVLLKNHYHIKELALRLSCG